ncbi:hypothetical protein TYRP_023737 [Tyrophagus putrescentiae]|nr:hypothetical protein TYRP_023737 [Tyrophagus putrescentiae]
MVHVYSSDVFHENRIDERRVNSVYILVDLTSTLMLNCSETSPRATKFEMFYENGNRLPQMKSTDLIAH